MDKELFGFVYLVMLMIVLILRVSFYEYITGDKRKTHILQIGAFIPIQKDNFPENQWKLIQLTNIFLYTLYGIMLFGVIIANIL